MTEQGERPESRVVVPDDVIPAGRGPGLRRSGSPSATAPGRRQPRIRFVFLGLIVAGLLLVLGTTGIREWWAHRLHDIAGGSKPVDFVIGLFIGALPLIGIALGRIGTRGAQRIMRMFIFGAAGFVVSYLLSPSLSRYASDSHAGKVFDEQAPGYLWGVLTANVFWLVVLGLAYWRFRRWKRGWLMRHQGPA